jgi:uncharacterized membrane protein
MAVLFATMAAIAYGLSDFVGGVVARRTPAWSVAFVGQVSSTLCTAAIALFSEGAPTTADFAWAVLAGIGGGAGTGFLYRGLATGRMGVVAPVSAVGAAAVPVVVGAATGERPSTLVWLGVVAALPGIWLVSSQPPSTPPTGSFAEGLTDGVLAGLGFGLLFAALGQIPDTAGLWPLTLAQAVSVVAAVLLAVLLRADWVPRQRVAVWATLTGPLGAAAALFFLLATQHGYLAVAGVIASLYPAATIVLAATVLHERIHLAQACGLALCGAAITVVAAG